MNKPPTDARIFKRGVLLALGRDASKNLFAARGDDALWEFLQQLVDDERLWKDDLAVDFEDQWQMIQAVLTEEASEEQSGALAHCLLGGRPLFQGSEMSVHLVRPDMVPHVAGAIREIDESTFASKLRGMRERSDETADGSQAEAATRAFTKIQRLYQSASASRLAVVFAVRH